MDEILRRLSQLEERLSTLERRLGMQIQPSIPVPPAYQKEESRQSVITNAAEHLPQIPTHDFESVIGRWWLGIAGAVALFFGASFFLKYAFENNLIGPIGRVAIEVCAGLIFVIGGEMLRKKIPQFASIVTATGLGLFYLSIYSAQHWYGFVGSAGALGFMSAVTAFGVILAVMVNAQELAGLAVLGGFLTPFLVSTQTPDDTAFFAYLLILSIGIFAVSLFKKWHSLILLGFCGMIFNFISWFGVYYDNEKLWFTVSVLALFYLIYLFATIAGNMVARVKSMVADLAILSINAAWFFGWCYYLLQPEHEATLGFLTAALGLIYIALGYAASATRKEDPQLTLFLSALAVVFLTIAIPLELEQRAITIAWAAEAFVLFALGITLGITGLRFFGMGVLALAVFRLFGFDSHIDDLLFFIPVFNTRFLAYIFTTACSGAMAYLATRYASVLTDRERGIREILWSGVNVLVVILMTIEIVGFFDARIAILERTQTQQLQLNTPRVASPYYLDAIDNRVRISPKYRSLTNQRNASISVAWTLYAVILITLGFILRNKLIRWSALLLFALTVGKVFIIDLAGLRTEYRIISFTVLGAILLLASYLYFRYQRNIEQKIV
ncbi:MAG: hypothetical protein G01um101466_167 [Parcubacteria group bacterium Gr01-1014_66]|nr:MAG: hypothetical protein G01um101466_167 [Parcubacteria group bacterium Gr01-1014_66]